nr:hypothetical protein BaRGS_023114 [Batillaria attramentaria]
MSPVTTQTTWDDVTDLDSVIERLVEKKMETMTQQLEDRLTQQQANRTAKLHQHPDGDEKKETRARQRRPCHMTQQLNKVTADVQALKNANVLNEQARGTTYIRWGNKDCPDHSNTVYSE